MWNTDYRAVFYIKIQEQQYRIDLKNFTQVNVNTNNSRRIRWDNAQRQSSDQAIPKNFWYRKAFPVLRQLEP